jgi:uncharacterized protein YecT (DUF1311 family)
MRIRAAVLAAFVATQAHAAPQFKVDCSDPQSNSEMKFCTEVELKRADAELNEVYQQALTAAREGYRKMHGELGYENMPDSEAVLRKAQRAWVAFRDANCDYQYQVYYGGSLAGLSFLACKSDMTKARVHELKAMMNGGEEPSPPQ